VARKKSRYEYEPKTIYELDHWNKDDPVKLNMTDGTHPGERPRPDAPPRRPVHPEVSEVIHIRGRVVARIEARSPWPHRARPEHQIS
jgi:hypothetical protein